MPKVTEEHRAAQRQRIQQAAMEVVHREGLGGTTMGAIIKESGLSAGAIYGYYASKDELVLDVADGILGDRRQLLAQMAVRDPLPTPAEMVREFLSTIPRELVSQGLVLQFWGELGTGGAIRARAHQNLAAMLQAIEDYLTAWAALQGSDPDSAARFARRTAPVVGGLAQGFVLQGGVFGDEFDREAYLSTAADLLDRALAA